MRKIRVTVGTVGYYDAKHAHKRMTAADGPFECEDTQAEHFVSAGVAEYVGGAIEVDEAYCCGICVNVIGSCFERCRYGGDAPRRLLRLSRVRTVPCPEPGRGGVAARGGALRIRRRLRCARRRSARFRRAA